MELITLAFVTRDFGRGRLICAAARDDGTHVCYFKEGLPENAITNVAGFEVTKFGSVAGGGMGVVGRAEVTDGQIPLPISGPEQRAAVTPPQLDLFADLNSAFVLRNGERPEVVLDWLRYHAREHGLQAVLIVDRAEERDKAFEAALAAAEIEGMVRSVVLRFDIPLGREGLGDARHPIYSPDAPGRDDMDPPPVDPWRAPFGERALFDVFRLIWLGRARGVLNIELSDLIAPAKQSVFDMALESETGTVQLVGRRTYPWSLDDADRIRHADHVCIRFDGEYSNPLWCVAPSKMSDDVTWRLVRVVGAPQGQAPQLVYYRCVALRHPTVRINQIVPKSTLVEEPKLLQLLGRAFDHDPKRPPTEDVEAKLKAGRRTVVVTCMKNEGPFILEWIAYHRMLGIEKFIVYTNDCTDGTTEMLDLLQTAGIVEHYDNPFRQEPYVSNDTKPQYAAFFAAAELETVKRADWLVCMDCDEFINIHVGDGRLSDLFDAVPDANLISMTWRLIGNSDVDRFEDRPIIDQFHLAAPHRIRNPHHAWGFKTLFMNAGFFKKLGVHRPNGIHPQLVNRINWVNGSGKRMPRNQYRTAWRSTSRTFGYDLVTLNHYACRSAESFLVKRDRGRVNHVERDQGMNYWFRMNHNAEEDSSIKRMVPPLLAEIAHLKETVPGLAAQHDACVIAHREKIDVLRASAPKETFYQEITSERTRALSRNLKHFGRAVFSLGPDVLPDNVLELCADPEFYFTPDETKADVD